MPLISQVQTVLVLHRMHFWARYESWNTDTWAYEGREYQIDRPSDGSPAGVWTGNCSVCGKGLTFRVHSVAATQRARTLQLVAGLLCLVLVVLGFASIVVVSSLEYGEAAVITAMLSGPFFLGLAFPILLSRAAYIGFRGHGAGWPGFMKHQVVLPGDPRFSAAIH